MLRMIANQFRKPTGLLGAVVGALMEKGNRPAIEQTLAGLSITDEDRVLEIGFGPGIGLQQLLSKNGRCRATGIDFSPLMVKRSAKRNRRFIREGRLELIRGDFTLHNFPAAAFSKIFGVNVIYFWEDLPAVAKRLHRILADGGRAVFAMADRRSLEKLKFTRTAVFNRYEIATVVEALRNGGFRDVEYRTLQSDERIMYIIQALKS